MTRLLLIAILTLSTTARAETDEPVSEQVAVGLSFSTTLGSYALFGATLADNSYRPNKSLLAVGAAGIVFGPTAGHVYAGHYFTRGLAIRLLGLGIATLGVFSSCGLDAHESYCPSPTVMALGGVIFLGGTIDDFVTLPGVIRARNARDISIAPAFNGRGVTVSGRF